jgi:hypothetical protein
VVQRPDGSFERFYLPEADGKEERPFSLAVDLPRGRIYVGGSWLYLYAFDLGGTYLGRQIVPGDYGVRVSLNATGRLYATTGHGQVHVFKPR